MKQKNGNRLKSRVLPGLLLLLAGMCVLVFALANITGLQREKRETELLYKKAREAAHLMQPVSQLQTEEAAVQEVDFQALLDINADTIGWLHVEGMEIDYPVVRSLDNEEYLYRGFDGTTRRAGTLFLDKDADANFSGLNHPIYGHNMKDGSMFGALKDYLSEDFALEHLDMMIYTPEKAWQLIPFSVYTAKSNGDYHTQPENQEALYERAQGWANESEVDFSVMPKPSDRFITLVTCTPGTDNNDRIVLHAIVQE